MHRKISKSNIGLYYYNYPNIGDILNEILIEQIFHVHIQESKFTDADMIAIGSILDRLLENGKVSKHLAEMRKDADCENIIHIWGTGLMYSYEPIQKFIRPVEIHALRGRLTAEIVTDGYKNCVLADPGLLASRLFDEKIEKKYDVGIVPHYVDAKEEVFCLMKEFYDNSVVIDVKAEPKDVIRSIAECRMILSTSLHGLIIADSFHIPNQWCECSDRILGDGFKFRDYYSSYNLEMQPLDLKRGIFPSGGQFNRNIK